MGFPTLKFVRSRSFGLSDAVRVSLKNDSPITSSVHGFGILVVLAVSFLFDPILKGVGNSAEVTVEKLGASQVPAGVQESTGHGP
jgi:hypothetical protein